MEELITALFEYSFLCFVFLAMGFLFGYVLKERHAAKRRQHELEETNKVLNLFANLGKSTAKFCHEISNYIGAISANVALLEKKIDKTSPGAKEAVATVKQVSNDLIDIARGFKNAVRGRFDDRKRWLFLQDLIESLMLSQTRGAFKKLNIDTECRCEQYWYVSQRITEAFLNLIINACEAMETVPKKRLSIVAEKEDACLVVRVSDSGSGVPPEEADRIFEYGFTTKPGGSGQGMNITKEIIEENNGTISVESNADAGTTFTIHFLPQEIKTPKVLVADDDTSMITCIKACLPFCEIQLCQDKNTILQKLPKSRFDLVFLDHRIARADDAAILRELRKVSPATPVVIMAVHDSEKEAAELMRNGANRIFAKPSGDKDIREIASEFL